MNGAAALPVAGPAAIRPPMSVNTEQVRHIAKLARIQMSDAEIETKCRSLCAGIISASQTDELVRLCWSVAALPEAGAIARAAVPAA